jgi:hypothetical protein
MLRASIGSAVVLYHLYILDAEVEKCRELEDEYKRLRAEYVLAINEGLSKIIYQCPNVSVRGSASCGKKGC